MQEVILTYGVANFAAERRSPKCQWFGMQTFTCLLLCVRAGVYLWWLYFTCFLILFEEVALIWDIASCDKGQSTRLGRNMQCLLKPLFGSSTWSFLLTFLGANYLANWQRGRAETLPTRIHFLAVTGGGGVFNPLTGKGSKCWKNNTIYHYIYIWWLVNFFYFKTSYYWFLSKLV